MAAGDGSTSQQATSKAHEQRDVFISYAREDTPFVQQLHRRLTESGKKAYVDWDIPKWSEDWQEELYRQIEASDTFVAILSPDSVDSPYVGVEVEHAAKIQKRLKSLQLRTVDDDKVPKRLRTGQWIDFRERDAFDERFADFVQVLETDADWVRDHTRFGLAARDWQGRGQDRSLLLGRSDLRDAEEWLARQTGKEPPPTELHTEFILASRTGAAKRRQKLLGAILIALVVAIGLAVFALIQRDHAIENEKTGRSRELAATAVANLGADPEVSVQLAREADRVKPTPEAEDAVQRALIESHVLVSVRGRQPRLGPGTTLAVIHGRSVSVWDWQERREVAVLMGHAGRVTTVAFDHTGRYLVTSSRDKTARVWRLAEPVKPIAVLRRKSALNDAAFSDDGKLVVTAGDDGKVVVWKWSRGRLLAVLSTGRKSVSSASFGADDRLILARAGSAYVWRWRTRLPPALFPPSGHESLERAELTPAGDFVLTLNDRVEIWETATGRLEAALDPGLNFTDARLGPDGQTVFTTDLDGTLKVWMWLQREDEALAAGGGLFLSVAVDPTGSLVAAAGEGGVATIWDWRLKERLAELRGHDGAITAAEFSEDGNALATQSLDGSARVWSTRTSPVAKRSTPPDDVFVAHGPREVVLQEGTVRVRDRATRKVDLELEGLEGPTAVALSSDGKRLAVGGSNPIVRVWDVDKQEVIASLRGKWRAASAAFSPDGSFLVVTPFSFLGLPQVWDVESERTVAVLHANVSSIFTDSSFSRDGRRVFVWGADEFVWVYACKLCVRSDELWRLAAEASGSELRTTQSDSSRERE